METYRNEDFEGLQNGSAEYAHLDNPIYRVCIEPAKNAGYVKVRCVDDPALFSRSQSSNDHQSTISEKSDEDSEEDEVDEIPALKTFQNPMSNLKQKSYDEAIAKSTLLNPPQLPAAMMKRRNSFDPIGEEEEDEEDAPTKDFMETLREKVGQDNYIKPKFGPSERELAKVPQLTPSMGQNNANKERRPSGVMPLGFEIQSKLLQEKYKNANEKKKETKPNQTKPSPSATTEKTLPTIPNRPEPNYKMLNEDDDYAYVTLKPIPLQQFEERNTRGSIINENCFQYKEVPIVEDDENDPYPINAEKEKRCYLSSKRLMSFFANQFFDIARRIGKGNITNSAQILPPTIMCREGMEDSYKELVWSFIPSIEVGFWPDEYFEYFLRKRPVMKHKKTNVSYQWPSPTQITAVRQIGCNIAPIGYSHPKKSTPNADADIEWEILFTKAELYLTRNFHHPKVRVYVFALLMYKCYFEAFDGIKEKHIRHIIYMLVERNPVGWTEENIGEKFMLVLSTLKTFLVKQKMPHYFMKKCNMFANIPNHKMRQAQEKVHRIKENPVMFVLNSILKLQSEKSFYPKLNVAKLYKILTTEQQLSMMNPALLGVVEDAMEMQRTQKKQFDKDGTGDRYQARMRKLRENIQEEAKKTASERDQKDDVIDLQASIKAFDQARKSLVLEFFTEHFIKMAKKSNEFRNHGQSYMYIVQSENLVTLLEEMGFDDKPTVSEFKRDLLQLQENVNYKLYFKDYWNISYGHAQLSTGSFRTTLDLPSPPVLVKKKAKKQTSFTKFNMEVTADIHDTESDTSDVKKIRGVKLENFDVSESMDFDWDEVTHL
eukprot:GFUD01034666.1.p1 GENE.GFUD01034666.1~~GFUD01034666.1.p1  ORF type:complete len:850 (+),score=213.74 GFUD01034666.1:67-2550(+)